MSAPTRPFTGEPLTIRELQVLFLIAQGYTDPAAGKELHLSPDTIKSHLRQLYRKLGAVNRPNAVAIAFRLRMLRYDGAELRSTLHHGLMPQVSQ
jgi:ATP/maltotriose-dependent transcriptional regulator MalT